MMTLLLSIAIYVGLGVFLLGCLLRILRYARTPVPLVWDLLSTSDDEADQAGHRGSYFEETNWSKHRRHKHSLGEIVVMLKEIFVLHGLWKINRPLWRWSFPFHTGLYLLLAGCSLSGLGILFHSYAVAAAIFSLAHICAWIGLWLTLFGSSGLAWRRITDPNLRPYTVPGDLINLGGFALACLLILAGSLSRTMPPFRETVFALLTFQKILHLPVLAQTGILVGCAMTAYIPYTQMAHFIAKYVTYYMVSREDAAMKATIDAEMAKNLAYHPTWAASHVAAEGAKGWAEIATTNPVSAERSSK
ncbi:MAG: respiratory nitrate reductase subunit gamma [Acidobacteriota bacterium]